MFLSFTPDQPSLEPEALSILHTLTSSSPINVVLLTGIHLTLSPKQIFPHHGLHFAPLI